MNPSTVFIDPLLTSVYVGYQNTELIADILFPKVMVNKESGLYFKNDKSNLVDAGSTKRALTGQANRVTGALTTDTYQLEEHSLEEWIDDRILKTYDAPFEPRRNATNRIAGKLSIEKEKELIAALLAATGTNFEDEAGSWATTTTNIRSIVLDQKDTMQQATGVRPNTLVVDRPTYNKLIINDDIVAAVSHDSDRTEGRIRALLASYFDLNDVIIAGGIEQTAASGGTGSFLWGTKGIAYLAYINPAPAIEETSAGYQFVKEDMIGVDARREEGNKSDVVRATDFYSMKVVDSDCLYRFLDTVVD